MGFRGRITCLFLMAMPLWAQAPPPPPTNLTGFTCVANAGIPPLVRAEGLTELVNDVTLRCTGGTPTAAGSQAPRVIVQLILNTGLTSRVIDGSRTTEAILLIDDPLAPTNPTVSPVPCITPEEGCPGPGPVQYGVTAPNLFFSVVKSSSTAWWNGIPLDPPVATGVRTLRITNIRGNANSAFINALALNPSLSTVPITGTIVMTDCDGNPIPVTNSAFTLARAQPSFGFAVGADTFTQYGNAPPTAIGGGLPVSRFYYGEQFPGTFIPRSIFSSPTDPNGYGVQGVPGLNYLAESRYVPFTYQTIAGLPSLSQGYLKSVLVPGLTDTGTVHKTTFEFPLLANFRLQFPTQVPMMSNGTLAGLVFISPLGGTVVGNNIVFTPNAGSLSVYTEVIEATPTPGLKGYTVPYTVLGSSGVVPAYIQVFGGYANELPLNFFTPSSPNNAGSPNWGPLENGIRVPPGSPYQIGFTIANALEYLPTLNFFGPATPISTQLSGPITPRVYNVGIVSSYQMPMNVTLSKDPSATWLNATLNSGTTPATVFLSVNPSATTNKFSTTLQVTAQQAPGQILTIPVTFNDSPSPWLTRYGFTQSASYVAQVVSPGMPFLIGGGEFGPSTLAGFTLDANGKVVTTVGNTQALFDGQAAPLIYSVNIGGVGYVAGIAPFELAGKTQTNVQVVYNGVTSPPVTIFVVDAVPGLLTADSSGGGEGAILNADGSVNSEKHKASPNDIVAAYGGGGGQTTPVGRTGGVTGVGAPVGVFNLPVKVFLDGAEVTDIPYARPAPDLIEGYFQVNFRIPATARRGNLPVQIQIGDKVTQPGVTVAVK